RELTERLDDEAQKLRTSLDTILDQTYSNLLTIATFVANDDELSQLFLAGAQAVAAEGGGAGGERAAATRARLFDALEDNWLEVQRSFSARQLHFHLGPGSTSFLRVHRPERFGDNMDEVRYTVVDTNREQTPRSGFETGRVYSGLRGVVPVFAREPESGDRVYAGALETGTSFEQVIGIIRENYNVDMAVLLSEAHVRRNMWPEAVERQFQLAMDFCSCVIEASTDADAGRVVEAAASAGLWTKEQDRGLVRLAEKPILFVSKPLRDYRGSVDPSLPDVGRIVFWSDASRLVGPIYAARRFNLLFGIAAYVMVEILLLLGIRVATRRLEQEVEERTEEVRRQKTELERLAVEDGLTGALNRRGFERQVREALSRARRTKESVSLLMMDIDFFKRINDSHGHEVGDRALVAVTGAIRSQLRDYDLLGRIGGEEFAVLLPNTSLDDGLRAAERILAAVRGRDIVLSDGKALHCTVSIGVSAAQGDAVSTLDELLRPADEALYRAKGEGRNRVLMAAFAG
ncbi:MAG: diguanylate cyclase, partial [Halieaceae bacterium]|nr:diguanylate cyclase [Halieaceae bacterium]